MKVPLVPHGDEARFRAQAWGRVEAPVPPTQGLGLALRARLGGGFSRAKARERAARKRKLEGCSVTWGSIDPQVVLADCLYCRSRRAAFGPPAPVNPRGKKGREGLAHRLSPGRRSAGEAAPETGSRWQRPRAREQRSRFVAGRVSALQAIVSSTSRRSTRKRGAKPA